MGNENVVAFLLQNGADPNSVTHRGETPLHFAARARRVPIMTRLLDHGALPDAKSKVRA
jgi:ankyrin repeat protein